jgi:hypothetical protein
MSRDCPSVFELLSGDSEAVEHARGCVRCRALLALAGETPEAIIAPPDDPPKFDPAPIPTRQPLGARQVGELVSLRNDADDGELLLAVVLATGDENDLQVAPLTTDATEAAEWDLILEQDEGVLGYAAVVEVWNHGRVNENQLAESLGALTPSISERLLGLYEALRAGETPPPVGTGPPLLAESDPRLLFQEAEGVRARRYWRDAEERITPADGATAAFGARLSKWLDETGTDAGDLATDLGWSDSDLARVLAEQINPAAAAHSADRISDLIQATDIEAEEAEELLPGSVIWSVFPEETTIPKQEVAMRRAPVDVERRLQERKEAGAGKERDQPTSSQKQALESYVREIVSLVEEGRS